MFGVDHLLWFIAGGVSAMAGLGAMIGAVLIGIRVAEQRHNERSR